VPEDRTRDALIDEQDAFIEEAPIVDPRPESIDRKLRMAIPSTGTQ